jgi:hypothetical protein
MYQDEGSLLRVIFDYGVHCRIENWTCAAVGPEEKPGE